MSFHKKPAAPALTLKQSGSYGKLPSDAIVGLDRRDLPPSLRRGTSGLNASSKQGGRSVKSYLQGTQTSQRKDIGLNVHRLARAPSKTEQEVEVKEYGAPTKLPSLYQQTQMNKSAALHLHQLQQPPVQRPPQPSLPHFRHNRARQQAPIYVPLQLAKSREVTDREAQQISKTCRYVRRKGSLVDPPSFYCKR